MFPALGKDDVSRDEDHNDGNGKKYDDQQEIRSFGVMFMIDG
jgi:hypothetical protein